MVSSSISNSSVLLPVVPEGRKPFPVIASEGDLTRQRQEWQWTPGLWDLGLAAGRGHSHIRVSAGSKARRCNRCSIQFSSVAQSCPTLCHPMNHSTPGLSVHHQLLEITQTHVLWVGDAIQPSHPLSSPSLPAPNPSQHQDLFQWVNSLHEVAKVLEFQLQHQSFQWTPRTDLLQNGPVGSPCSPRDSQESPSTPQFKSINSLGLSYIHSPTLTFIHNHWKNHSLD